jgi:hypothetical protein
MGGVFWGQEWSQKGVAISHFAWGTAVFAANVNSLNYGVLEGIGCR